MTKSVGDVDQSRGDKTDEAHTLVNVQAQSSEIRERLRVLVDGVAKGEIVDVSRRLESDLAASCERTEERRLQKTRRGDLDRKDVAPTV